MLNLCQITMRKTLYMYQVENLDFDFLHRTDTEDI